jgi:hypothetical protein
MEFWQKGDINDIAGQLLSQVSAGLKQRADLGAFMRAWHSVNPEQATEQEEPPPLIYKSMPESKAVAASVQLGLFDSQPVEQVNRALDYLTDVDRAAVVPETVRSIGTIRTRDNARHESVVLVTAKLQAGKQYAYKLYSNVEQLQFPLAWLNASAFSREIGGLNARLGQYGHQFYFEGDQSLKSYFKFDQQEEKIWFSGLRPFHQEGSLVVEGLKTGTLKELDRERNRAVFEPLADQKDALFYRAYLGVRDGYYNLYEREAEAMQAFPLLREKLNQDYAAFKEAYGELNRPANRRLILADEKTALKCWLPLSGAMVMISARLIY